MPAPSARPCGVTVRITRRGRGDERVGAGRPAATALHLAAAGAGRGRAAAQRRQRRAGRAPACSSACRWPTAAVAQGVRHSSHRRPLRAPRPCARMGARCRPQPRSGAQSGRQPARVSGCRPHAGGAGHAGRQGRRGRGGAACGLDRRLASGRPGRAARQHAPSNSPRGCAPPACRRSIACHADVAAACRAARDAAAAGGIGRVLVFGSFVTVEQALRSGLLPAAGDGAGL